MKRSLFSIAALMTLVVQAAPAQDAGISRGEYVARLANCVACHSIPEGEPFAGGLKMDVPFLGAIYTTNITPDKATGIGDYTLEDFDNAVRGGVAKDGHNLYPAMPYPSYAKMSDDDISALYDFFMKEVKGVNQANLPAEIPGWKSPRWPLKIWNMLFVDNDPYEADDDQSAAWNRGAYLVQGPGHCGACHTPRGLFFQEKGLDEGDSAYLAGAPLDNWSAPSLNQDVNSGLGRWSVEDIAEFMQKGINRHGTAFGTMVEVINTSTAHMTADDLTAMATYLKSLPAVNEKNATPYSYSDATVADLKSPFGKTGARTYFQFCVSCHSVTGNGYAPHPPLAGNPVVLDPDPSSLINLTINGSLRVYSGEYPDVYGMPYFRLLLDDQQIADVLTFIRSGWGNNQPAVSAQQVADVRAATDPTIHDIVILRMK
ncbi:MAG: cytochrome c [Gammaproteobacteria bacterium]|nr:cytochrome c [Gammaproteobacteria bacterium]